MWRIILVLCAAAAAVDVREAPAVDVREARRSLEAANPFAGLQAQLDGVAAYFNTSFSLAIRWGSDEASTFAAASGDDDRTAHTKMTTASKFPLGSATKTWTAVAALRANESGAIDLDGPAAPHVDKLLENTSLEQLYGTDAITFRELLSMRAGVQDYDDELFRSKVFAENATDYEPLAIVFDANHTLLCQPGTCGAYSSVGYVLAGLALADAAGAATWDGFDQKTAALGDRSNGADFAATSFPTSGSCADAGAIHEYAPAFDETRRRYGFFDIIDDSCLNGWAMGNILTTPSDLASFWYALFRSEDLVSAAARRAMTAFAPLTVGWSVGLEYGLGAMLSGYKERSGNWSRFATLVGHGGEDYGSLAEINGFNPALNFSITLAMGSAVGMNCSNSVGSNYGAKGQAACYVYDQVLQAISPEIPRLECGVDDTRRRGRRLDPSEDWTCVPF